MAWNRICVLMVVILACGLLFLPSHAQTGACCFADCSCHMLTEPGCSYAGGIDWIEGEVCDPNACQEAVGPCRACCIEDGCICEILNEEGCTAAGGEWTAQETCNWDDYHPELYACQNALVGCCLPPTFECQTVTLRECLELGGNLSHPCMRCGQGAVCVHHFACCLPGGSCELMPEWDCESAEGIWLYQTLCDPNPCPTVCACCFADGACEMCTPEGCVALGGEVMPPETVCDPNPCGATDVPEQSTEPTEQVTWGRIKSRYHD